MRGQGGRAHAHVRGASGRLVLASMLAVKVKLFDDGLYAAAELVTQGCKVDLLALLGVRAYLHAVVCENAAHHHLG